MKHTLEAIEKIRQAKLKNPTRYWLGKKRYPETIAKMREKLKGKKAWNKGIPNPNILGEKNPAKRIEVRRKISLAKMGHEVSIESRLKSREWNKGKHLSIKTEFKKGDTAKEKNINWKGGITPQTIKIRQSLEYKLWRTSVFERDNYACIWGGKEHGSKIEADHIKPFAYFPELRFAIDNGRTLCHECHKTTDTYLGKARRKQI